MADPAQLAPQRIVGFLRQVLVGVQHPGIALQARQDEHRHRHEQDRDERISGHPSVAFSPVLGCKGHAQDEHDREDRHQDAKRRDRTTVLVGDGASDQKAALLVDVLFAKDGLARWCDRAGVPYHAFATLADVQAVLLGT